MSTQPILNFTWRVALWIKFLFFLSLKSQAFSPSSTVSSPIPSSAFLFRTCSTFNLPKSLSQKSLVTLQLVTTTNNNNDDSSSSDSIDHYNYNNNTNTLQSTTSTISAEQQINENNTLEKEINNINRMQLESNSIFQQQQQQQEQQQQQQQQSIASTPPSTTSSSTSITTTTDPFGATGENEIMTTLAGGTSLMFDMIRSGLLGRATSKRKKKIIKADSASSTQQQQQQLLENELPRWYPYSGVSLSNPSFRTTAPTMTNEGFARSMWRNLRKHNKPSLWRNALRTYDRMGELEDVEGSNIRRTNIHYEAAMLACAKLGLWQRALEIYHYVYQKEQAQISSNKSKRRFVASRSVESMSSSISSKSINKKSRSFINQQYIETQKATTKKQNLRRIRGGIKVSDDMIFSLVKACVRASYQRSRKKGQQQQKQQQQRQQQNMSPDFLDQEAALRRIPLDTALEVLSTMEENHNLPIVAHYINPLAKAYQSLGYISQARDILQTMLSNRTAGEEPEDGTDVVNVYDFSAKDKGSYSLLVQGSVLTGDWGAAVQALGEMIDDGLYPNSRHCNLWSEISERQTRPRAVGSWKKKRDDFWTDSVI